MLPLENLEQFQPPNGRNEGIRKSPFGSNHGKLTAESWTRNRIFTLPQSISSQKTYYILKI